MDTRVSATAVPHDRMSPCPRSPPGVDPQRTPSLEYKHEAARLATNTGRIIAEVAGELGVGAQTLGKWVTAGRAQHTGETTDELSLVERTEHIMTLRTRDVDVRQAAQQVGFTFVIGVVVDG